jgi:hypothetical protein
MIGTSRSLRIEQELFDKGFEACKSYECDYRTFDPAFGVLICRKKNEQGEFYEELTLPSTFYVGEIMHIGVNEKHQLHMKKETEMTEIMTDMINNEIKTKNLPHNGVDAQ